MHEQILRLRMTMAPCTSRPTNSIYGAKPWVDSCYSSRNRGQFLHAPAYLIQRDQRATYFAQPELGCYDYC